ncbi:MAG: hypothetical protein H6574_02410 [Lewinellaceae bacterium]|nr:hypothetical protein [Saprospiraceae bacterium]MCB9329911.1 hypothetical protein [Lewinellaceae bacterium]
MRINDLSAKLTAFGLVIAFGVLIWLYTREFAVFTNTIGAGNLVLGAMVAGILLAAVALYAFRQRLQPWDRHVPEIATALVFTTLFAPLFASLINRAGGPVEHQSFEFVSEIPYLSSNYGLLKGEKIKPSGIRLQVKEAGKLYRFQYKMQPYFPITEPGERILLPMRKGLLGFRVLQLK